MTLDFEHSDHDCGVPDGLYEDFGASQAAKVDLGEDVGLGVHLGHGNADVLHAHPVSNLHVVPESHSPGRVGQKDSLTAGFRCGQ